jgi:hypothetical protein
VGTDGSAVDSKQATSVRNPNYGARPPCMGICRCIVNSLNKTIESRSCQQYVKFAGQII